MPHSLDSETPRREIIQRLVGAGVAVAGTNVLTGCATVLGAVASPASQPAQGQWDMTWTTKLGKYRTAYHSPGFCHVDVRAVG